MGAVAIGRGVKRCKAKGESNHQLVDAIVGNDGYAVIVADELCRDRQVQF